MAEWTAAMHNDPGGSKGLLVPVRVAEATGTGLLGPIGWIDLVGLDEDQARAALLEEANTRISPRDPKLLCSPGLRRLVGAWVAVSLGGGCCGRPAADRPAVVRPTSP